jgi:hypothetical protein
MNFKTTVILFIALIVVGLFALMSGPGKHSQSDQATDTSVSGGGQKLIDADPAQVTLLMIIDADGNRAGVQKVNGKWRMTEPISSVGSDTAAENLIGSILSVQSQGRPNALTGVSTGLDKPQYRIELALDDGRTPRVALGEKTSVGDLMYASVDNGDVNLIDPAITKSLKTAADDLRDKHLMGVRAQEVRQFRLTWGGKTISASKFQGKWSIRQPNGVVIDGDEPAILALLSSINDIQVNQFVKPDADALQFAHFDRPSIQIWLTALAELDGPFSTTEPAATTRGATTEPIARRDEVWLTVGAPASLSREDYYIKTSDGIKATVPADSLNALKKTAMDLRDRQIFTLLPADVQSISIQKQTYPTMQPTTRGGPVATPMVVTTQQIVLVRRTQSALAGAQPSTAPSMMPSAWQLVGEPKAKIDAAKVDALLDQFHPLRAEDYLEKHPTLPTSRFYVVELKTSHGPPERLDVTEPANDRKPFAIYNGLLFEVSTGLTDMLDSDFHDTTK